MEEANNNRAICKGENARLLFSATNIYKFIIIS